MKLVYWSADHISLQLLLLSPSLSLADLLQGRLKYYKYFVGCANQSPQQPHLTYPRSLHSSAFAPAPLLVIFSSYSQEEITTISMGHFLKEKKMLVGMERGADAKCRQMASWFYLSFSNVVHMEGYLTIFMFLI